VGFDTLLLEKGGSLMGNLLSVICALYAISVAIASATAVAGRPSWELGNYIPPSLPYTTKSGTRIYCDKDKALKTKSPAGNTKVLLSRCPVKFHGEVDGGIFATFDDGLNFVTWEGVANRVVSLNVKPSQVYGLVNSSLIGAFTNGLWLVDKAGEQTQLNSSIPFTFWGTVQDQGIIAGFTQGLLLIKYNGTSTTLAVVDAVAVDGKTSKGIVAEFVNGLYFIQWNGTQTQLNVNRPTSVREIHDDFVVACFNGIGLLKIVFSGGQTSLSPTCDR
jgi:hypothetical protein